MTIDLTDVYKYPWVPSLKTHYKNITKMDREEFVRYFFSKFEKGIYSHRILNIFKYAFENYERIVNYESDELNVFIYPLLRILLETLDDKRITNRIANLYSKQAKEELDNDIINNRLDVLYNIAKDLNLDINFYDDDDAPIIKKVFDKGQKEIIKSNFSIYFTDYLNLSTYLQDKYRKLSHQSLINGYIYLNKFSLARLIQEFLRNKIIKINIDQNMDLSSLKRDLLKIKEFKDLYDTILKEWDEVKTDISPIEITFRKGDNISEIFPPCIREILKKADEQQNLLHNERLILVFFLLALDYPNDNIIEIFSRLPDFDNNKTTYQIEFAKKKGYIPHSCDTIKSLKLCMAKAYNDKICLEGYFSPSLSKQREIKHPLSYVRLKKYRLRKQKGT